MCVYIRVYICRYVFIPQSPLLPVSGEKGAAFQQLSDNVREREIERERERGRKLRVPSCSLTTDLSPHLSPTPQETI